VAGCRGGRGGGNALRGDGEKERRGEEKGLIVSPLLSLPFSFSIYISITGKGEKERGEEGKREEKGNPGIMVRPLN